MLRDVASYLTDIERGFVHTVVSLFRHPGEVVLDYWRGRTVCYYAPFRYFFVWTAVLLLVNFWLGVDDVLQAALQPSGLEARVGAGSVAAADRQFDKWLKLMVFAQVPINSASSFVLFRGFAKTYGEHLILNSYVMGQLALLSVFAQVSVIVSSTMVLPFLVFSFVLGVSFYSYTLSTVFPQRRTTVVWKATLQALVGVLAYAGIVAAASVAALALNR